MSLTIRRLFPGQVKNEMLHLISEAQEIRIAVAWAQAGHEVELALRANAPKIKKIVVGMDFNGSDPAFLGFYGKYHLSLGKATGTFHPKIYYFQKGKQAACIEGSSNFTKGAFERNAESGTLITGHVNDPFFKKTRLLIDQYAENGIFLKPAELQNFETISQALRKREKKQRKQADKIRRKREKEQKKRRQQAQAKEKKRRKAQKNRQKKHYTAPSSLFFNKKKFSRRRRKFFSFRTKFMIILALLGGFFYYQHTHPPQKAPHSPPQKRMHFLK